MFTHGRKRTPNGTKGRCSLRTAKGTGNLLLDFHHPQIPFCEIVRQWHSEIIQESEHHLNKRGGVIIGDVVGLGKTLMATALARIMQDDYNLETLIICPKNLVQMWEMYLHEYSIVGRVCSLSNVQHELPGLRRYRLVVIDESHNLRNREGKRYKVIKEYIEKNESKCVLLTATPYNKTFLDISAQLRLFLSDEASKDLSIRPEKLLSELGEATFNALYQCPVRSLTAFEKSPHPDDWRELMRHYLVRRTRSFIQTNYAHTDAETGRPYLAFPDGTRSYFPVRTPRTVTFALGEESQHDPYALLYSEEDELQDQAIIDLYNEKAGILDGDADVEIDLASQAYQIWKNATDADPHLKSLIEKLPNVSFSTRAHQRTALAPEGVLVYMRTAEGNDSLAWINRKGESVTQSQLAILRAAACDAMTPAIARPDEQHELVKQGVAHIIEEETHGSVGQLGSRSGARLRTYQRLIRFVEATKHSLFPLPPELNKAIDEIYRYPLQETARDTLNRQLRAGASDDDLVGLVIALRDANRLCHIQEEDESLRLGDSGAAGREDRRYTQGGPRQAPNRTHLLLCNCIDEKPGL